MASNEQIQSSTQDLKNLLAIYDNSSKIKQEQMLRELSLPKDEVSNFSNEEISTLTKKALAKTILNEKKGEGYSDNLAGAMGFMSAQMGARFCQICTKYVTMTSKCSNNFYHIDTWDELK